MALRIRIRKALTSQSLALKVSWMLKLCRAFWLAGVALHSDTTVGDLTDVVEGNRVYIHCIYVSSKIDQLSLEELGIIYKVPHCASISAYPCCNFGNLLENIWY